MTHFERTNYILNYSRADPNNKDSRSAEKLKNVLLLRFCRPVSRAFIVWGSNWGDPSKIQLGVSLLGDHSVANSKRVHGGAAIAASTQNTSLQYCLTLLLWSMTWMCYVPWPSVGDEGVTVCWCAGLADCGAAARQAAPPRPVLGAVIQMLRAPETGSQLHQGDYSPSRTTFPCQERRQCNFFFDV